MSASYDNPDSPQLDHNLSRGQLEVARFIEEAALQRIKELLTRMGVTGIRRADTMQTLGPKMARHKISLTHIVSGEEGQDGWWFQRNGKAEIHLRHPEPDSITGTINFQARFIA